MSTKQRVTRRDLLKRPDEFLAFVQQTISYFKENQKVVVIVTAAAVIAAASFGVFTFWRSSNLQQALFLEQEGNRLFSSKEIQGVSGMEQIKPVADVKKALEKYKLIIQNYSGTKNAERALVYIGDCYFRLKQFDEAEKSYLEYLKKHPKQGFFSMAANQSLGYVYEAKRDYDNAIKYFLAASAGLSEEDQYGTFMDVARCYEEQGKSYLALEYYQKIVRLAESESGSIQIRSRVSNVDIDRIKGKIARLQSRP